MSRRWNVLAVVVGIVLLAGVPVLVAATGGPDEEPVGKVPPAATPDPGARAQDTPSRDAERAAPPPAVASAPRTTAEPTSSSISEPVELEIPTLGVVAPVTRVGLLDDGGMEVPEDVATVGWYDPGVAPGEAGTAVIAGHVDSRDQGRGVFFELGDLDVDDEVVVTGTNGADERWQVVGRAVYAKDQLPIDELFVRGGPPRLALITCGGEFDASARSYRDNVVILLEPAA